jgi:MFS family permease
VILSLTALELMWNASSYKIRAFVNSERLGDTLYGVIYVMVPGVLGAALRPLAGYLSDKYSVHTMFLLSVLSYSAVFTAFTLLPPPLFLIAWFVPVYQFFDQAIMMNISRALPMRYQSTAAGTLSTAWTIAGLSVLALSPLMGSATLTTINLMATILFAASYITALAMNELPRVRA